MATLTTLLTSLPDVGESLAHKGLQVAHKQIVSGQVAAGNTYELFTVPKRTLVESALSLVREAWGAGATMTLGDGASAAGFLASADIAPNTDVTTGIMVDSDSGGEAYAKGKLYEAEDTIDLVVGGTLTAGAGTLDVFVVFSYQGPDVDA